MLNTFLEKTRRNAFIPIITCAVAIIIFRIANLFRLIDGYHFVYSWGCLIGYFLIVLCIIFSVVNGVFLIKKISVTADWKYDLFLLLINCLPLLYFIYMAIQSFTLASHFQSY